MPPTIKNFSTLRSFIRPYNLSFQQITSNYFKFTDLGRSFQPCCQILANWSQSKVEKQITVKGSLYLIVTHGKLRIGAFVKGMGKLSIVCCNLLCFSVISLFFFNAMFFTLFYIILNLSLTFAHYLLLACGWVGALWKKRWNSTYENNKQFIRNTTEKLQMLMVSNLICLFPLFHNFLSMFQMNTLIMSDVVKFIELALLDFHLVLYSHTDIFFLIIKLQNLSNITRKRLAESSANLLINKANEGRNNSSLFD